MGPCDLGVRIQASPILWRLKPTEAYRMRRRSSIVGRPPDRPGFSGAPGISADLCYFYFKKSEMGYAICCTIEEFLEMTGVLIFIFALLGCMAAEKISVSIRPA
jgi:hypothetical protein